MFKKKLFISILLVSFLLVATIALLLAPRVCQQAQRQYTLRGNIVVENDCDGKQASIPKQVTVESILRNNTLGKTGRTIVALRPDPAAPNDPKKIGSYMITVVWTEKQNPTRWDRPKVLVNNADVCLFINNCTDPKKFCRDGATATHVPLSPGGFTTRDIRVVCMCFGS